jgi:signal transduction histidine kinase
MSQGAENAGRDAGQGGGQHDSLLTEVFAALDVIVAERAADGSFRTLGAVPGWFTWLYPQAEGQTDRLRLEQFSPFLENFLVDAEEFWREGRPGQLRSGPWAEAGASGKEDHLEASALSVAGRRVLLISLLGSAYEERRRLLQIARENALVQRQLVRETQQKEILLHCIVHDLVGLLTGVKVSFSLLGAENLTPGGREYLSLGQRQHAEQERLIQEITHAFAAEMEALGPHKLDPAKAPDALACAKEIVRELTATAAPRKVNLQLDPAVEENVKSEEGWRVAGEKLRLERVLSNLVENALRHAPPFSTVTVGLHQDGTHVQLNVDDEGAGVPPEMVGTLFHKFAQGAHQPLGHIGFGLYYCRVMVERWGGNVGYLPRQTRGSRFWVRLPKLEAS